MTQQIARQNFSLTERVFSLPEAAAVSGLPQDKIRLWINRGDVVIGEKQEKRWTFSAYEIIKLRTMADLGVNFGLAASLFVAMKVAHVADYRDLKASQKLKTRKDADAQGLGQLWNVIDKNDSHDEPVFLRLIHVTPGLPPAHDYVLQRNVKDHPEHLQGRNIDACPVVIVPADYIISDTLNKLSGIRRNR